MSKFLQVIFIYTMIGAKELPHGSIMKNVNPTIWSPSPTLPTPHLPLSMVIMWSYDWKTCVFKKV